MGGAAGLELSQRRAALQPSRSWEDGDVQLFSVRERQVGLTGGLSRMHCLGEREPAAIHHRPETEAVIVFSPL